jgi:hypothetical protein
MFVTVLTKLWQFSLPSTKVIHSAQLCSSFFKIRFNIILQSTPVFVAKLLAGCWHWMGEGGGVKMKTCKRKNTVKAPRNAVSSFQEPPHLLKLWMCSQLGKCLWKGWNAGWSSEVSVAAATPCRQQQCKLLGSSASRVIGSPQGLPQCGRCPLNVRFYVLATVNS